VAIDWAASTTPSGCEQLNETVFTVTALRAGTMNTKNTRLTKTPIGLSVLTLSAVSLVLHLAYLPPTLEDLDSVNFALGVRHFDVAQHQPHPPGYPVFIALGKIGTATLRMMGVGAAETRGLAIWSALAAAALPLLLFALFRRINGEDDLRAGIAAVIAACCPLFWFSGVRPLSDMAGLAAACAALAALASNTAPSTELGGSSVAKGERVGLVGGLLAGISIGFRSQMALLTLPFLVAVIVRERRRWVSLVGAAIVGVAIWAIPLIVLSGGPAGYIHALRSQAGEDFSGVVMLWTHHTPRAAVAAFLQTFVRPWDSPVLAGVMLAFAGGGLVTLALRARKTLALLLVIFGPYALFHLVFQETVTTRYALPLIPLFAYLAADVVAGAESFTTAVVTVAIAAMGLSAAFPAMAAFAATPSPIFGLLSEMRLLQARGANPLVAMHRRVFTESRRARLYDGDVPGKLLPAPRDYEWLEVTRAWLDGYQGETWFVADPRRTDLALIDREQARTRQYRWPFDATVYVGGARPNELAWHIVTNPGWFLEQGWALTPEVAGIADRDGWGPHRRPSIGWVRRRATEALMMIGGRHLGSGAPVRVVVGLDDKAVASMEVQPGFFLDFVKLPAGALVGGGPYAKLVVMAQSVVGGPTAPLGIEQFNLQDIDRVQFGFDQGWFEPEYNPTTARSWRWMSEKAIVRVHNAGRGVVLRVTAESPLHYFNAAPLVRISAGDRVLSELRPSSDFTTEVSVPANVLSAANGRITITSDHAYVAGQREGTGDQRRLALRVYSLVVEPQAP
jgi:Protein O-mannosyl-transferase TMEM260-like